MVKSKQRNALSPDWHEGRRLDDVKADMAELLPALAMLDDAVAVTKGPRAPRSRKRVVAEPRAATPDVSTPDALAAEAARPEFVMADFSEPLMTDAERFAAEPPTAPAPAVPEPQAFPAPEIPAPVRAILVRPRRTVGDLFAYFAAMALAAVAGFFSVSGMAEIFPGAPLEVMVLAGTMEVGKLVIAGWLAAHWRDIGWNLRAMLSVLVVGLALINGIGVFGRLVEAHVGVVSQAQSQVTEKIETSEVRINAQVTAVADLDRRIAQIDGAIDEATRRGRVNAAMSLAEQQRKAREALVQQRGNEANTLTTMRTQRAALSGERAHAEAAAGPVRYLATLAGTDTETAVRWLILLMVLCCDPAAIALTIAASGRGNATA
ncbi:hypothetical protein [Tardiphaga sp.]|uniref:hypothetical protein n=1 Tax=Tardiphaga sp. TaxID=1926292 RepID=UPI0025DC9B19|nr:hypothetical protein [Tardiphaga sp.]